MKQTLEQPTMEVICENSRVLKAYILGNNIDWNNRIKNILGEKESLTEKVGFAIVDSDQCAIKTSDCKTELIFKPGDGGVHNIRLEENWLYNTLSPNGKEIWIYENEQALKRFTNTTDAKRYIVDVPDWIRRAI